MKHGITKLCTASLLALGLTGAVAISPAQAATIQYFNGYTMNRETVFTPIVSTVGGNVFNEFSGAGLSIITTQTLGSSQGIGYIDRTHIRVSGVRQYCQWSWSGTWNSTVHLVCNYYS